MQCVCAESKCSSNGWIGRISTHGKRQELEVRHGFVILFRLRDEHVGNKYNSCHVSKIMKSHSNDSVLCGKWHYNNGFVSE